MLQAMLWGLGWHGMDRQALTALTALTALKTGGGDGRIVSYRIVLHGTASHRIVLRLGNAKARMGYLYEDYANGVLVFVLVFCFLSRKDDVCMAKVRTRVFSRSCVVDRLGCRLES